MTNDTSKRAKIKKVITLLQHIAEMSTAAKRNYIITIFSRPY